MPDNRLPDGWRVARLGDVATVETGGTPSRAKPEFWGGTVRWMSSGEVNQRRVASTAETITQAGVESSNAKVFLPGTIMLAMNGQGSTRGKIAVLEVEAACNQSLAAIRGGNGLNSRFLLHNLDSRYGELRSVTGDDARSGLNLGLIRGLHLILPPPDEQAGIAEVLDSIDAAIEKSEAVIAATERLRSALLGELLTRGVPGPHTEWKTVQLREVIGLIIDHRGITPKKLGGDFAETGIPVVSAISIRNNRIVLDDETRYVSEKMYRRWMPVELHAGDVVLTSEAPLGQVAAVGVGQKYCLGQRLFGLRSEPTQMCPEFLYYSLLSPFVQAQLRMRPLEPLPREYVSPS